MATRTASRARICRRQRGNKRDASALYQTDELNDFAARFDALDARITRWMARYGLLILRISLGVVFFWFGVLKFFPGMSPAHDLAARTIETLSFGSIHSNVSVPVLATWECLIGIGLLFGIFMRATLLLLAVQMAGTLTPLVLFPTEVFTRIPYAPTLEGQYIIKNAVLISAAIVLGATVRGGHLIASRQESPLP
jgi:uncharacterized membrane protein YphA (DoxX/SURF4 family)